MPRYGRAVAAAALLAVALAAGCGGEGDPDGGGGPTAAREELDETRSELARTRDQLRQERERAAHLLGQLQEEQAGHSDFLAALAVAFAAVLAAILLLQLLIRERQAREALAKLMRWIRRGSP